jgi:four helix bundle protein
MENNNATQRSTSNAQRNNYPRYNNQQAWKREGFNKPEAVPQQNGDRGTNAAIAQNPSAPQKEVKTFRDLAIWQKGISLVKTIYQKTGSFPKDEIYGLVAQMRRASVSIPSNIAEGYRRRHSKEFQQFLNISLGSLGELETQIVIAGELNYLASEAGGLLLEEIDHLTRMIISLSKKVDR